MKEKINLEEEYNKVKNRYNLPEFKELNSNFELYNIKKKDFLLRNIRRRMNEKLIFYCRILEGILYPNTASLVNIQENRFFNEDEKSKLSTIYKKLMVFERESLALDITSPTEEQDAIFIKKLFKEWKDLEKSLLNIVNKMKESWAKEEEKSKESPYFG